jgi:hypothetical protein
MAVLFLFIIILSEVLIDSGRFSLLKVRYKIYFSYSHYHVCVFAYMIISLTKIYCPSELK